MRARGRQRARIRFRPAGVVVLVSVLLLLLTAWNTGINLLYLMFGGGLSLLLLSIVLSRINCARLRAELEAPGAVYRGEPFKLRVRIENPKRFVPALGLRVARLEWVEPSDSTAYVPVLPGRMAVQTPLVERLNRRGAFPLPAIRIESDFPFGFFVRRLTFPSTAELLVYPRIRAVRPGAIRPAAFRHQTPRIVRGEGDEFFSLREYRPGDDVRQIAWRASAKRGALLIRELARQTSRSIVIAVDLAPGAVAGDDPDSFEDAIELAASCAITLLNQNYRVAVATPSNTAPLGEGTAHGQRLLELLARAKPAPDAPSGFEWLAETAVSGSGVLCISCDAAQWGRHVGRSWRVLQPGEVLRA